jgi:hypothetical protein
VLPETEKFPRGSPSSAESSSFLTSLQEKKRILHKTDAVKGVSGSIRRNTNGDESWSLPLAARCIVRPDGIIHHAHVDTDHTRRPEPAEAVGILQISGRRRLCQRRHSARSDRNPRRHPLSAAHAWRRG